MEYYDKYVKYKTKYMELKDMYGGWFSSPKKPKINLKHSQANINLPVDEDIYIFFDKDKTIIPNLPNSPLDLSESLINGNFNFYYIANKDKGKAMEHGNSDLLVTPILFLLPQTQKLINSIIKSRDYGSGFQQLYKKILEPIHVSVNYVQSENISDIFKDAKDDLNMKILKIRGHLIEDLNKYIESYLKSVPKPTDPKAQPNHFDHFEFKAPKEVDSVMHIKPTSFKIVKKGYVRMGTFLSNIELK
jgi:hypothetical protein